VIESIITLLLHIVDITQVKLKDDNAKLYITKHNECFNNVLKPFKEEGSKEALCNSFMEQVNYLEEYSRGRLKETQKLIADPIMLTDIIEPRGITLPKLLDSPSFEEEIIEHFRIFLFVRQAIPKLIALELKDVIPVSKNKVGEEAKVTVNSLIVSNYIGVECYECRNSILRTRILIETPEGIDILAPEYDKKTSTIRIAKKFSYNTSRITIHEKEKTRLVLKENKTSIELIFENEAKAAMVHNALNRNKNKYTEGITQSILKYLENCEIFF